MFLQPKNVPKEYWMIHTRVEKMNSKGQQNNRYKIMIFKLYVPQLNFYFFVNTYALKVATNDVISMLVFDCC